MEDETVKRRSKKSAVSSWQLAEKIKHHLFVIPDNLIIFIIIDLESRPVPAKAGNTGSPLIYYMNNMVGGDDRYMVAKKITFSGRVQGVFFRSFIKHNADNLDVNGYVKNLPSGTVEAVFEGEKDTVNELIEICRRGPKSAHVENVKIEVIPVKPYLNFEIIY